MSRSCRRSWKKVGVFKKLTGNKPSGRSKCRWENNIRMDLKAICINMKNWVDSAKDRGYLESPWECGIEALDSIIQAVIPCAILEGI